MMFAVVFCNVLGFTVAASMQSIISGAADATTQGRTMGAVSGLQSLMAVVAPVIGAPLLGIVSHLPRGDWRIGAPFYFGALVQATALFLAWSHFHNARRSRLHAAGGTRLSFFERLTMTHDRILILDFGSQVTQLIARRVREAHVFCEIHPNDVSDEFVREFAPKGVILSGSHASTYEEHELRAPKAVFELGVPVLGICYGMFTMAVQLGGEVEAASHREFGYAEVRARGHTTLLDGLEDFATAEGHGMLKVWMSHGDKVTALPPGFALMASTPSCPIAGMADEQRRFYGVQFHPEVTHTVKGRELLERFVLNICGGAARLGDGQLHRRGGRAHPRAGRRRRGDPGPVGRRRFERRRGADPQGDRRQAHLRLRRPRAAAQGRRPAGDGDVRRAPPHEGDRGRRERAVFSASSPASSIRRPSARSSARSSSTSSCARPAS